MQSSIIFWYIAVPREQSLFTQRKRCFRKSFFGNRLNLGFPKDCGSGIDQVETGAWNDVVDSKKQHGETKQNFTKQTQLAAPCKRRHQREGMSTRGWQGKLRAGRFEKTAQS